MKDDNRQLMIKMGDTLDGYMTAVGQDSEFVSFDILDSNRDNPNSVEAMYQQIELKIEQNR